MIYHEEKSSGMAFPIIVILLAMAIIVFGLVVTSGNTTTTRVWIPASTAQTG